MYELGAVIAVGAVTEDRVMLGAALDNGVTPMQVKEIVYQASAYVGIARVIDFLHATNELLAERGVTLPLEGQSSTTPETRNTDGLSKQKEIVGDDAVDGMYANASADARRFQEFLSGNCFGDSQLLDVLTVLMPFVGYPRTLNGLVAVDEVAAPK